MDPDIDIDLEYRGEPAIARVVPVYSLNGGHYQYNWSTKNVPTGLYRIFAILQNNQQVYTGHLPQQVGR